MTRAPLGMVRFLAAAFVLMGSLLAPTPVAAQKAREAIKTNFRKENR